MRADLDRRVRALLGHGGIAPESSLRIVGKGLLMASPKAPADGVYVTTDDVGRPHRFKVRAGDYYPAGAEFTADDAVVAAIVVPVEEDADDSASANVVRSPAANTTIRKPSATTSTKGPKETSAATGAADPIVGDPAPVDPVVTAPDPPADVVEPAAAVDSALEPAAAAVP